VRGLRRVKTNMGPLICLSGEAEKGIGLALSADGTFRPMTGINSQIISQREDLPPHTFYKQLMAAARKIGSAD